MEKQDETTRIEATFIAGVLMQAAGASLIVEGIALLLVLSRAVSE